MSRKHELDVENAHDYSIHNRTALTADQVCGCFDCLNIFSPSKIEEYTDESPEETAICPYCGSDSIIGESSGYPITHDFLRRMRRRWFESGTGIEIATPFGRIHVLLDGEPICFQYRSIDPDEKYFPNVDATYRLTVNVELDGRKHLLKLQIGECDASGEIDTGERLEAISFYNGRGKLTLGCHASFVDSGDYGFDYDGRLCEDGIEIDITPKTKTQTYKFGVCWLNECSEKTDVQTWFGADPTVS